MKDFIEQTGNSLSANNGKQGSAGRGQASVQTETNLCTPDRKKQTGKPATASNGKQTSAGRGQAIAWAETISRAPDRENARKGGCPARRRPETIDGAQDSHERQDGHGSGNEAHGNKINCAAPDETHAPIHWSKTNLTAAHEIHGGCNAGGGNNTFSAAAVEPIEHGANPDPETKRSPRHDVSEAEVIDMTVSKNHADLRFADPIVQEIVEVFRARQSMVRAQTKLILQAKAICRRFVGGDLKEADKLYKSLHGKAEHDMAQPAMFAAIHILAQKENLDGPRKQMDKALTALGKKLPIAHMADKIKGLSHKGLAEIVAEAGDLSAYEKGLSGIKKRMGIAVIDGERQRKKSDPEKALLHGYDPQRRSTLWVITDVLMKAQGSEEKGTAGPYRIIYSEAKAKAAEVVETAAHAHNRAMRIMSEALLRDLYDEWRAVK